MGLVSLGARPDASAMHAGSLSIPHSPLRHGTKQHHCFLSTHCFKTLGCSSLFTCATLIHPNHPGQIQVQRGLDKLLLLLVIFRTQVRLHTL